MTSRTFFPLLLLFVPLGCTQELGGDEAEGDGEGAGTGAGAAATGGGTGSPGSGGGADMPGPSGGGPAFSSGGSGGSLIAPGSGGGSGGEGEMPGSGGQSPVSCDGLSPPEGGVLTWLHAGDIGASEGASVSSWESRSDSGDFGSGAASYGAGSATDSAVVRFDGNGQRLYSNIPIAGLDDATFALVSRTNELKLAGPDWCQSFNMAISENGCSGTFGTAIMWDEAGDWGFTFLGPVLEQISWRFGNGSKTYSNLDDPGIQALMYDPNVAWRRPASIGDALTSTVAQKEGGTMRLFVDGELVLEQGVPGGAGAMKNMHDTVWLGGGRGDWHWAGEIAELLVYGRKLSAEETAALNAYLLCEHPEVGD